MHSFLSMERCQSWGLYYASLGKFPSQDGSEDLQKYQGYPSLNDAIQGDEGAPGGESAPMAMIHMSYLQRLHLEDGHVQCRQDLPEEALSTRTIDDSVLVLALSYCWVARGSPDPQGKVLADICRFTEYLEESRHFDPRGEKFGIKDQTLLLFWDYLSLHQIRGDRQRTKIQEESFQAGLGFTAMLYSGFVVCM